MQNINMKENRKVIITSIIVAVIVVATLTATYAYFQARIGTGSTTNTTVTAKTIDGLTFNQGTNLSITATQTNFASGKGNLSSSTSPTVTLKARNDAAASYNYKACLNVTENSFVHSQISSTETSNGRTVNLLPYPYDSVSSNKGITFTDNKDGGISVSGTATGYASVMLSEGKIKLEAGSKYYLKAIGDYTGVALVFARDDENGTRKYDGNGLVWSDSYSNPILYLQVSKDATASGTIYPYLVKENSNETYDQYGYIENADLELTVTKNGTTVLTKDITHGTGEICIPTTSGGSTTTHTISAAAGATTTDTWNATVTFKNYNNNQNINLDKTFNSNFVFTRI